MEWNDIFGEMAKVIGGGTAGVFGGMWAERKAAKSDAVQELQTLKGEYKEFAQTMKVEVKELREELVTSRSMEKVCEDNYRELREKYEQLDRYVRSSNGIPEKPTRKPKSE
jgi:predicted nuclease with TOPRIM domain